MRRFTTLLYLLIAIVNTGMAYTVDEIPNVHVKNRLRYVSNPDGILSRHTVARADSIIQGIWDKTTAEVVVVAVKTIGNDDIDTFATELFTKWGIGKKDNDNGLLLLIVTDQRKAVIRTGYGMEGVVPDIIAGRVIHDDMIPHFKEGDYNSGVIEALRKLEYVITTPGATEELKSQYENDAKAQTQDWMMTYLGFAGVVTIGLLIWFIISLWKAGSLDLLEKYRKLEKLKLPMLMCCFLCLGMPLLLYIILIYTLKHWRLKPRVCPNCENKMRRLDEVHDNEYLTPAQDMEERYNSIDYDVWLCDACGETDILPYVNKQLKFTVCEQCGARMYTLKADRILRSATPDREGEGVRIYSCLNCGKTSTVPYTIPTTSAPVVIPGGGRGRGFGGGGGFSGGIFGGGRTGGGGASGGW